MTDDRGELDLTKQIELKEQKIEELKKEMDILKDRHQLDMLEKDAERLFLLLKNHALYTGSKKATLILDQWDLYLPKFIKIVPVDYRRALLDIWKDSAKTKIDSLQRPGN